MKKIRSFFRALRCFVTGRWEITERSPLYKADEAMVSMLMSQSTFRLGELNRLKEHYRKETANLRAQLANAHARFDEHLAAWKVNADVRSQRVAELEDQLYRMTQWRDQYFRQAMENGAEALSLRPAARLWEGLIGCGRMSPMGWAGFDAPLPGGLMHLTVNLWNIHHDTNSGEYGAREMLTRFAEDVAVRLETKVKQAENTDLPGRRGPSAQIPAQERTMPNREIREQNRGTRYTPEMKKRLKAEGEARRAKMPRQKPTAPGLGGDMARGIDGLKNRERDLDAAIAEQGG